MPTPAAIKLTVVLNNAAKLKSTGDAHKVILTPIPYEWQ